MPLIRRIPKRGFNNASHATNYIPVNLEDLNQFDDGASIGALEFRDRGLANGTLKKIKILGGGDLKKKLTVTAHAFSASARQKIEAAGGSCKIPESSAPAAKAKTQTKAAPRRASSPK